LLLALAQQPDLREAARLDQAGRCQESERIYQQALAQGAPGPALLNNTGNHYLACGQPEKAREYFERLVKAVPAHPNGNLQLARMEIAAGAFARAEDRLTKLVAKHPGDFDLLFLLGRAAARAGHAAKAREALESALRLKPDDAAVMLEAGLANAASGDYPRAVFLLARAHSRAPDQPGIALALARASEDAGYYGDAVVAYDRYLSLTPKDSAARRDRARARALTVNGSTTDLQEYVTRNPSDALGHFYLAQVTWKGDSDTALASLAEAVRRDPRLAPAHVARAWLLHRLGRDEEALAHLDAVPDDLRALDLKGVVLLSLDRVKDAETVLRKAAAIAPNDADVALHLGRALMDQGKDQEGQRWLDKYQKLRPPRQRDARREAGMIELATLDPAGARAREIERFRAMAQSRPDDPLLQLHLANLLLADGQRENALREYRVLEGLNVDKDILARAGRALAEAGEADAARPFLQRAGLPLEGPEAEKALQSVIDLALKGGAAAAIDAIRRVESRWPEWARPWLVHGLILKEARRAAEAESKFRTAAALGSREDVSTCATLREWASGNCRK
jgi:Flp pilus assembly protein TadD